MQPALGDGRQINAWLVACEQASDHVEGDDTPRKSAPLDSPAGQGQLSIYHHGGFRGAMETLHDLAQLAAWLSRFQAAMPLLRNRPHDTSKPPRACPTATSNCLKIRRPG